MFDENTKSAMFAGVLLSALGEGAVKNILTDIVNKADFFKVDPSTGHPPKDTRSKTISLFEYVLDKQIADLARKAVADVVREKEPEIRELIKSITLQDDVISDRISEFKRKLYNQEIIVSLDITNKDND